jgi:single-strand DNA-binding protein
VHTPIKHKKEKQMNQVSLTGNLTADPELRALPDGEPVCELRLAVEGMAPGRETGYITVTCFGSSGEAAARVLTEGWLVAVDGRLQYHRWEAKDGSKRSDYGVVGHVEFLSAPRKQQPDGDAVADTQTEGSD